MNEDSTGQDAAGHDATGGASSLQEVVDGLQAAVSDLHGVLSAHHSALEDHDAAFGEIVAEVAELAEQVGAGAPVVGASSEGMWSEYEADVAVRDAQLIELRSWVAWAGPTLFFYRLNAHHLPGCWEQHPGVVEELLGLYAAWKAAYAEGEPTQSPTYWHSVFLGPALDRIWGDYQLGSCAEAGHQRPASVADPDIGRVAGGRVGEAPVAGPVGSDVLAGAGTRDE